jgi:hypothetical protein
LPSPSFSWMRSRLPGQQKPQALAK